MSEPSRRVERLGDACSGNRSLLGNRPGGGSGARRLARTFVASAGLLSSGAGRLVFGSAEEHALLVGDHLSLADGTSLDCPGPVSDAAWDLGGALLVVIGSSELWRLVSDGPPVRLYAAREATADDRWAGPGQVRSPYSAGSRVGFDASGRLGRWRCMTVNRDGSDPQDFAPSLDGWTGSATPRPGDPGRVAFMHTPPPGPYAWRPWLSANGAPFAPFPDDPRSALPASPMWASDGSVLVACAMTGLRVGVTGTDPNGHSWHWVAQPDGLYQSPAPSAHGSELLAVWQDLGTRPEVVRCGPGGREPWADLNEPPEWWPQSRLRLVEWKSGDARIEGVVATPRGKGPWPLVVDLHGGPEGMMLDLRNCFAVQIDEWVSRGFAAFAPDYRDGGIAGVDAQLRALRMEPGYTQSHDDVIAGIDHLVNLGVADPDQLFLFGFSMGGVLGARVLARDRRFRAAAFWEPGGMDLGLVDAELARTRAEGNHLARQFLGGTPDEVPEAWARVSVLPDAPRTSTPVLIMRGSGRPPGNVALEAWHSALAESELVELPGETHMPTPRGQQEILDRSCRWFDQRA